MFGGSKSRSKSSDAKKNAKKTAASSTPDPNLFEAEQEMAKQQLSALNNELEMLRAENNHMKRLVSEARDIEVSKSPAIDHTVIETLHNQIEDYTAQIKILKIDLEQQRKESKLVIDDKEVQLASYKKNLASYEQKVDFEFKQLENQLVDKDDTNNQLEMKIMTLEQQIDDFKNVAPVSTTNMSNDELSKQISLLTASLDTANTTVQQKNDEINNLKNNEVHKREIQQLKDKIYLIENEKNSIEENYQHQIDRCNGLQKQLQDSSQRLDDVLKNSVEYERKIAELENKLSSYTSNSDLETERVRAQLAEKEKSVWSLSEQLLTLTSENSQLSEHIALLKSQITQNVNQPSNSTSKPQLSDTESNAAKRKSYWSSGSKSAEKDVEYQRNLETLQCEIDKVSLEKKSLNEEMRLKEIEINNYKHNVTDLQEKVRLEKETAEKAFRLLESKTAASENALKSRDLLKNAIVPISAAGATDSEKLRVEIEIKEHALKNLCIKNEELLEQIENYEKQLIQQGNDQLLKELSVAKKKTADHSETIDELRLEIRNLNKTLENISKEKEAYKTDSENSKISLVELRQRFSNLSENFRNRQEHYTNLLGHSLNEIDNLHSQIEREKSKHNALLQEYEKIKWKNINSNLFQLF